MAPHSPGGTVCAPFQRLVKWWLVKPVSHHHQQLTLAAGWCCRRLALPTHTHTQTAQISRFQSSKGFSILPVKILGKASCLPSYNGWLKEIIPICINNESDSLRGAGGVWFTLGCNGLCSLMEFYNLRSFGTQSFLPLDYTDIRRDLETWLVFWHTGLVRTGSFLEEWNPKSPDDIGSTMGCR